MNQISKTKQFVAGLIGASLALSLAFAVTVKADSVSDLTAQINSLLATISSLQTKLAAIQGSSTAGSGSYTFSSDLSLGSKGTDVMNLQKVLNTSTDTQVASGASAGAPGYETSTFGPATKAAVIKFQKKNGVSGTGYVGPLTRAKLNAMSGSTTTTTTTTGTVSGCTSAVGYSPTTGQSCVGSTTTTTTTVPAGTGLTVSSPVQPPVTIAPYLASRVPFTKITLTAGSDGDVTVNSLTIQRTGLAKDAAFSSIVLLDENGLQIGTSKTFNSNHQTTLGDPFVVARGTSRTLTVAGNMETTAGGYGGQVASLTVVGVNTSATVTGALPITGAGQTINETLVLGTAQFAISQYDPTSALNKSIGDTGIKFSGVKMTAGSSEDVTLWSIRWNQTGSAGSTDLANVVTVVDGTSYPTVVSADGKYFTTLFPNGIVIQKGFSKDAYIQGDIVGSGSASRTVEFDIYNSSDVYISGNTYNFGIIGTNPNGSTATVASSNTEFVGAAANPGSPFFSGSIVTIKAGTVSTVGKSATAAPAANIAVNVPSQILGAFDTNIKGEPISVQKTIFHFSSNSTATTKVITSVSLVDKNGSVVAGPVDATGVNAADGSANAAGDQLVTFTDTITYPVGPATYTLVGKLPAGATGYSNGSTLVGSTTPSSDWTTIKGQITGNSLTLTNALFAMNTMTVRRASLAVGASSNPAGQTVVAGSQGFTFTNLQLDATQSGEDVRISTVPMHLTYSAGAGTDINTCQLFDGATALTTGSNIVNPDTTASVAPYTFTLDQSLTIPKGTVKTIAVKCNVSGASTAFSGSWGMTVTDVGTTLTVTGTTSSGSVTATGSATGGTMAVGAGSLAIATDSSSPSYTIASAGTTGVTSGVFKFRATNDSINLQRIVLKLTNTASSSDKDLVMVHLFNGNTEIGQATFTGGNMTATSTLSIPVTAVRDTDLLITAKVDLGTIGASAPVAVDGHLIAVDIDSNDTAGTYGTGISSGVRVNGTFSGATTAGIRMFKSFPTVAMITGTNALPSNAITDGRLMRFSVTADSRGNVGLVNFNVTLSTSSATVTSVNAYAFTDSAFSQAISGVGTGGQLLNTSVDTTKYVNSPTFSIYPQTTAAATTTIQIPAGQTRYFEIRGTVTAASGATNYSVVTTLKGDTAYPLANNTFFMTTFSTTSTNGLGGPTGANAGGNVTLANFLWSPNATTTAGVNDVDWTNGYAIPGLPSNGLIQSRTN